MTSILLATNAPPVFSHYASSLRPNSPQFYRPNSDSRDLHYYEAIQITVSKSGSYSLESVSDMNTIGYLYETSFNPSNPSTNLLIYSDNHGVAAGFLIDSVLFLGRTYILVVTTSQASLTGDFWISARGVASVNFIATQPIVTGKYNTNLHI